MNTKPIWQSKTMIGIFVAALPTLLGFCGVKITDVGTFSAEATAMIDQTLQMVGALLAAWGRIKATSSLSVSSPTPPIK
jgi:hypothetical protein